MKQVQGLENNRFVRSSATAVAELGNTADWSQLIVLRPALSLFEDRRGVLYLPIETYIPGNV